MCYLLPRYQQWRWKLWIWNIKYKTDIFKRYKEISIPVIRSNERFVLDDAIEIVTNKFDKYFIPNENELLFLENFKNKKYTPELLFDDKTIVDTIINHPMAIWKTKQ